MYEYHTSFCVFKSPNSSLLKISSKEFISAIYTSCIIRNFKEIRKQSFLSSLNDNKYYYTPDDYKFFNEKFFKIEKENFFKITNFKEYNGTITLFLDIFSAIYHNEIKSIKTSETLETNKKLILSDDDIHIFLDVISY